MTVTTFDTHTCHTATQGERDQRRRAWLNRTSAAVRAWFARGQLGPVDNYVTR